LEQPVILGRVSGLFGVQGWVKVFSFTRPREAILDYDRWFLSQDGEWQPAKVAEGKQHSKTVIVRLDGIHDRDQAAALIGKDIAISRDDLPKTEVGSYYWADLEGMQVLHRDGTELGEVAYLMETGANDVLVTKGERERLIPFIADQVILDVDFAKGIITVDWEWD
jgi:16S rRNA processing protein RimM